MPEIITEADINGEAHVPDKTPLQLRITIGGNGQAAKSAISWHGRETFTKSDSFTEDIGGSRDLDGVQVHVTTLVTDVSTQHNDVSIKVELLAGGNVVFGDGRSLTLAQHGGGMQVTSFISILID